MPKLASTLTYLSLFCFLLSPVSMADEAAKVKVAYVPITVRGDYQPLDAPTVNRLLLEAFKASAPEIEFVSLEIDPDSWDPGSAFETAKQNGVELIVWGSMSFKRSSQNSRDIYERGRLKLLITAIGDIEVASVATQDRILSQPTMVTSTGQSESFVEGGDPQTEKRLAQENVQEIAKTVVEVVRERQGSQGAGS